MEILNGFDPNTGGKYHNYGIHGTGLSTAADSLAAIKKYVYEEKTVTRETRKWRSMTVPGCGLPCFSRAVPCAVGGATTRRAFPEHPS